jgi:tRNA pseudouridine55 synthase
VDDVRKITGESRVGHTGTLDPFAEGLLIVLVGREATKRQAEFLKLDKEYIATLRFGAETDTDDITGSSLSFARDRGQKITINDTKRVIQKFIGEISQIPPAYSAIKIKGKKAYELARKGEKPKLEPRKINIYNIKILNYEWPLLELTVQCSSGTYIRALARDIGRDLGCGAYLEKLIRTKIGKYSLTDAVTIDALRRK